MYKYMVDYLGGELEVDKSDSKARIIKKLKERLSLKPYLIARLKTIVSYKTIYKSVYHEIERYHYVFRAGKHRFEKV